MGGPSGRSTKWKALECRIVSMAWLQTVDEFNVFNNKKKKKNKIKYKDIMDTLEFKQQLHNNVYKLTHIHVYKDDIHKYRYYNRSINAIYNFIHDKIFIEIKKFKKLLCNLLQNNQYNIENFNDQEIINIAIAKHMNIISSEKENNNNSNNNEDNDNTLDIEFRAYNPHNWKFYTAWLELCKHPKFAIKPHKKSHNDDLHNKKKKQKNSTTHHPSPMFYHPGPPISIATSTASAIGVNDINSNQNQQQYQRMVATSAGAVLVPHVQQQQRRRIFTKKRSSVLLLKDDDGSISSSDNDTDSSDDDEDGIIGEYVEGIMDGPEDDVPAILVLIGHDRDLTTISDVSAARVSTEKEEQQRRRKRKRLQSLVPSSSSSSAVVSIDKLCTSIEESNHDRIKMIRLLELRTILQHRDYLPEDIVEQAEKELLQSTFTTTNTTTTTVEDCNVV